MGELTDDPALRLGIVPLRPLSVPDLLSGTLEAVRRLPGVLLGLGLLTALAGELLSWAVLVLLYGEVPRYAVGEPTAAAVAAPVVRLAVVNTVGVVLQAAVSLAVARAVFGHTTGPGSALRGAAPRVPSVLGVLALTGLLIGGCGGLVLLGVLATVVSPLGLLLVLPPLALMVYLGVVLLYAPAVAVLENASPIAALRRSRDLVHAPDTGWIRVFGLIVVAGAASALLGAVFELVSGPGATTLVSIVVATVATPATLALYTLAYVDARSRVEGLEGLWRTVG